MLTIPQIRAQLWQLKKQGDPAKIAAAEAALALALARAKGKP